MTFLEEIKREIAERDAFAIRVMATTDCTKEVADELARNIHPDFRDIVISNLIFGVKIELIHNEMGNTFHSALWSLRMALRTLILKVMT